MPYMLTVSDSYDANGMEVKAETAFQERIIKNKWFLYANTRNRLTITSKDKVIFYIKDTKLGGAIKGTALIDQKVKVSRNFFDEKGYNEVDSVISFSNPII